MAADPRSVADAVAGYWRTIAGVAVEVVGDDCLIDNPPDHDLAPFAAEPRAAADLRVTVTLRAPPIAPDGPPLFAADAWNFRLLAGGGYGVTLTRAPNLAQPVAIGDPHTRTVVYHDAGATVPDASGRMVVFDPFRYPLDQLLSAHHLAMREGFVVHAAGFAFGTDGIVVPGISGAGKSTLTGLVAAAAPNVIRLSDERMVVIRRNGLFEAWGTPWSGTAGIAVNRGVPLRAIVFIAQDTRHAFAALSPRETLRRLCGVVGCPWYDREKSAQVLATIEQLIAEVPAYELRFARDPGAVDLLLGMLRREAAVA